MITLKIKCYQCGKFNSVAFESFSHFDANAEALSRCTCGGVRTMAEVRMLSNERRWTERPAEKKSSRLALGED